jgi:hypothetical protein
LGHCKENIRFECWLCEGELAAVLDEATKKKMRLTTPPQSGFYPVQQNIAKGKPLHSLFNTQDEKFHAKLRRSVAHAYSMSNLVQFEPLVDSTIEAFVKQLESRVVDQPGDSGVLDFGTWLQFYAFDVIGELTFSKRLGFVDQGKDIDGVIGTLERMLNYFSVVSTESSANKCPFPC